MRITGGRFRGRSLFGPMDDGVRPTSDKVRQAIFNLLEHHSGLGTFSLAGVRAVDLFAGSGALGLEALSRGASYCLFVDDEASSRALIRRNIEALDLTGVTRIWRRDATELGRLDTLAPFGLAFLDPPYRRGFIEPTLSGLRNGAWLAPNAVVAAESDETELIDPVPGFTIVDRRYYGGTAVTLFRGTP